MVGIYRIFNIITGQSYIGQSKDIAERIEEHFFHRTAEKASLIDQAINSFGIQNFMFQILEICDFRELDWKEDYYIKLFQSNIYGYNIVTGGQHNIGDSNANAKLSSNDIYNIRECYNNRCDPNTIYNYYFKGIISISNFFSIWEGKTWKNIHMDVYTDDNISYYKSLINSKENDTLEFSDEDIMRFRNRYVNETAEEIYNSENLDCKFNTFRSILTGDTYKHLPVYLKRKKIWINN